LLAALLEYEKGLRGSADAIEGRLITGKDFSRFSLVLNLVAQRHFEEGEVVEFGYAMGIKAGLTEMIGVGIEFDKRIAEERTAHLTPGFYASLSHALDLRIRASFGLGDPAGNGPSVRSVIIYSF
jgi:hypothetical protein